MISTSMVGLRATTDPMLPVRYRVCGRWQETADTTTVLLEPDGGRLPAHRPGQFTMLYRPGVGEIPISISGRPSGTGVLEQTIRAVGPVSRALCAAPVGSAIGVRGPFGTWWDVQAAHGGDVVVVGGGCGLAPLRPALLAVLDAPDAFRRVSAVLGARTPADFVFARESLGWTRRSGVDVIRTVDQADEDWDGRVGLVTEPVAELELDPAVTTAFLCGPEVMIHRVADVLLARGVPANRIQVSLERSMKCGVGLCGHCQLGPLLICRDGPVLTYDVAAPLLAIPEL